jgi:nucleotide-binding universal stress UspA family protein
VYERILVAIDGSDTAQVALLQGIQLAREQQARLRLVHVVDELAVTFEKPRTPDAFWKAARKAGRRILADASVRAVKAGIEPQTKLVEIRTLGTVVRHVADAIVKDAERWSADLIVIGTHGRRGLRKLFLGSVADGVVRISGIPVLLIRGTGRKARRRRSQRSGARRARA